jgi:hypothetical protein
VYEDVEHLFVDLEDTQYQAYGYDCEKTVHKFMAGLNRQCGTISDREVLQHLRGFANGKNLVIASCLRSSRWIGEAKSSEDCNHQNFALLRHIALSLHKQGKTCQRGIKKERMLAAWKED